MSRVLRRLTASVIALALALGGVFAGSAVANAAEVTPVGSLTLPTSSPWGQTLSVDFSQVVTVADATQAWSGLGTSISWHRVGAGPEPIATGFSFTPDVSLTGATIYAQAHLSFSPSGDTASVFSNWITITNRQFAAPTLTASGEAVAGGVLTVGGSGWGATPSSFDWEWRRVSDNAVVASGAGTAAPGTYTVTSADVAAGSIFYAIVTAHLAGYGDATWPTSFSQAAHLAIFAEPSLSVGGVATAGSPLTVQVDSGWGAIPSSYDWEWRRVSDNALVAGGSGPTIGSYTVSSADVTARSEFYAIVTAHLADYGSATWPTSFSQPAHLAPFANVTAVPTVTGTGRLGTSFTASYDTTGVTPSPSSVTFEWRTEDGTIIASGDTFTPISVLLGEIVYVTANLHAPDHADFRTGPSAFSATVALAEFTPGAAPVITGRNALGGTLTASVDTSSWNPVPTSFEFQWFLEDGTAIPDADEATLAMTSALVGEVVYVVATAKAVDHRPYVIASAPTGRIAQPELGTSLGTVRAGEAVTVDAFGLLLGEEYTVELHSDPAVLGTAISGLDGTISRSFSIPASTPAGAHTIVLLHDGVRVAAIALTVTAAPAATIAATGADADLTAMSAIAALTFLAAGLVLVISRRVASRRSSTH